MTKKHFIALADTIRDYNTCAENGKGLLEGPFRPSQIAVLAGFCEEQNPRFNRERWIGYIEGRNGKNGGKVKA